MHALRVIVLLIGLAGSIAAGWWFIDMATQPEINPATGAPKRMEAGLPTERNLRPVGRDAVETRLHLAPEHAQFFDALKAAFPQDYERLIESFAARAVHTSKLESPDVYLTDAMRALRRSRGVLAARARPDLLERVFETQAKAMGAMAQIDPALCVDFLHGRASDAFFEFSASHRDLVSALAQSGLAAIVDGAAEGIKRPAPTDADFSLLEAALKEKGLGPNEISALLDGKAPDPPLPDAAMCRAGQIYFETLRSIPEAARMRIYALSVELLARS